MTFENLAKKYLNHEQIKKISILTIDRKKRKRPQLFESFIIK